MFELVQPALTYRSRDVDLIFHTQDALDEFLAIAGAFDLVLDFDTLDRTAFLRSKDDPSRTIQVDLFTSFPLGYAYFDGKGKPYYKPYNPNEFLPELEAILRDKVRTVPLRQGRDVLNKQEKDLLDIHRLAFHNRARVPAAQLVKIVSRSDRKAAAGSERIQRAMKNHPAFAQDFREVEDWLTRP